MIATISGPVAQLALMAPMLLPSWMDPETLIGWFGPYALAGVAFVIFAECGLFAILPGDSLLFTVGMFIGAGVMHQPLWLACLVLTVCAILGNACGYLIGYLIGPALFKPRSGLMGRLFNQKHVDRTHAFMEKYGSRALILARFVPIVRTFVTFIAGVSRMSFTKFITYTAIGGIIWAPGVTLLGYFLGNHVPFVRENIDVVLVLIVAVSLIPMGLELLRARRKMASSSEPVG